MDRYFSWLLALFILKLTSVVFILDLGHEQRAINSLKQLSRVQRQNFSIARPSLITFYRQEKLQFSLLAVAIVKSYGNAFLECNCFFRNCLIATWDFSFFSWAQYAVFWLAKKVVSTLAAFQQSQKQLVVTCLFLSRIQKMFSSETSKLHF